MKARGSFLIFLRTIPSLSAVLEPDALAEDNEVQLLPPIRKRVRVQVALTNQNLSALVNHTLDATGLRAAISENPELVIHETDSLVGSNSWSMVWSTVAATNSYTGPFHRGQFASAGRRHRA